MMVANLSTVRSAVVVVVVSTSGGVMVSGRILEVIDTALRLTFVEVIQLGVK